MPSISVLIPTKDRARSLDRVLPTYLSQGEVGQLVIVNDGSSDDTTQIARAWAARDPRVTVVSFSQNRGIPAAKNAAIDAATQPFLFFGEDDVELTPGYLETLLAHRRASRADIIAGRNVWRAEDESADDALTRHGGVVASAVDRRRITVNTSVPLLADTVQPLSAAMMLAPADLFRKIRFDEEYGGNGWREESDFQLRALASGARLVVCPHAVSYNYMLSGDRGGAHAAVGARRLYRMLRNNARFVRRNRDVIDREFAVGDLRVYYVRFAIEALWREVLLPRAVFTYRRIRSWVWPRTARSQ